MLTRYAKLGYIAMAALVAPALPLAAASRTPAAPTALLADVEQDANDIVNDAAELQNYARDPSLSWHSHAYQLESVKAALNDMSARLGRLESIDSQLTPVQQRALETAVPLVALLVANTTEAMKFVNDHMGDFWQPGYRKYVDNLYNQSLKLDTAVKEYREYAKVRAKEERLQSALGLKSRS